MLTCAVSADATVQGFLQCLSRASKNESILRLIYTRSNSSYKPLLQARINNLRFATPSTPKPLDIVTPLDRSQVQDVIYCAKKNGLLIRNRSGGNDFEGQSYQVTEPYVLLNMIINHRSIDIDVKSSTGATVGELYYRISVKNDSLGFPGRLWSTLGVGGSIGGGGYGVMKCKFGLAADNTLNVCFMDIKGRILDRKSMGEDLFRAIRGGGVSSFGVVLSYVNRTLHFTLEYRHRTLAIWA